MGKKNDIEENGFDDEDMTVTLDLEDGQVTCAIIVILTVEKQDYIVLLPLNEDGENEDGDVWIYRYFEDENDETAEPTLEYIEDDDEYMRAADAFSEYLEENEHDEIVESEESDES
ncbi:MAG: DUF1292 domain-containing protein [Lachnospiraceae bacterium]|nr:DUF1292 domain-containing protein [Lachnospiraceae bacterium]